MHLHVQLPGMAGTGRKRSSPSLGQVSSTERQLETATVAVVKILWILSCTNILSCTKNL
jgi:hypothetical protein